VQLRDLGAHLHAQLGVEVRQRLVHQEHLRLAHDRAAHRDALALAAGELRAACVESTPRGRGSSPPRDARSISPSAPCAIFSAKAMFSRRHVRVERVVLEHHRDVAVLRRQVVDVRAADADLALVISSSPATMRSSGRLAAARRPDEHDELAVGDHGTDDVFAVVATAGTTNFGIVDDLAGVAAVAAARGLWLHVDGAYGVAGAGRAERPPSSPASSGRLVHRRPAQVAVRAVRRLRADLPRPGEGPRGAHPVGRLPRRHHVEGRVEPVRLRVPPVAARPRAAVLVLPRHARHAAYTDAIEGTLRRPGGSRGDPGRPYVELLREPDLSVVVFRRIGWTPEQYYDWSDRLMQAHYAFVTPTTHDGETVTRFAIVNPRTTVADITGILDTMA
jgi:hypothetical protein